MKIISDSAAINIENKIVELTNLINNHSYSEAKREDWKRSRSAYRANLTRWENQQKTCKTAQVAVIPSTEDRVYNITFQVAEPTDKDANVKIKSPVTSEQLGWSLQFIPKAKNPRAYSDSQYYDVLAVHSNVHPTS